MKRDAEADNFGGWRRPGIHESHWADRGGPAFAAFPSTNKWSAPAPRGPCPALRHAACPLGNVRLDLQPTQHRLKRLAVIASVGVHLVG